MSTRKRITVKAKQIPRSARWRAKFHRWATSMWADLRGKTKTRTKPASGKPWQPWPACSECERPAPPWFFDRCPEHRQTCGCCCELGRPQKKDRPGRISRAEAAKRLAAQQGRPAKPEHVHHHWHEAPDSARDDTERADDQQEQDQGAEQGQETPDQPQDNQAAPSGDAGGGEQ